jgi:hypothetical protein
MCRDGSNSGRRSVFLITILCAATIASGQQPRLKLRRLSHERLPVASFLNQANRSRVQPCLRLGPTVRRVPERQLTTKVISICLVWIRASIDCLPACRLQSSKYRN